MPLKNNKSLPPGGWVYKEPANGFKVRSTMAPFSDAVKEILTNRKDNSLPRATLAESAEDLDEATCQRLGYDPAHCTAQKKTWSEYSQHVLRLARPAAASLSNALSGAKILTDWLGEGGKPVSPPVAQARANACQSGDNGKVCPHNKEGRFFTGLTAAIAKAIHEQHREKINLDLRVDGEDNLHTCDVCECHLPLKVWVPMNTLLPRTTPEQMEKFPAWCWMRTENRQALESLPTVVPTSATPTPD